jgi:hypothetical protein
MKVQIFKYHYGKWLPNGFITEPNTEIKSKNKIEEKSKTKNPS